MKRAILTIMLSVMLLCLSACGGNGISGASSNSLYMDNGFLRWANVADASYYEVDMGNGPIVVKDAAYDLAENCEYVGDFAVSVSAVSATGKHTALGAMNISAQKVGKPVISVRQKGGELYFTWKEVASATGYSYHAFDGAGVKNVQADGDGVFWVKITDLFEQTIRVVARGGSEGNQLFLNNEEYFQYNTDQIFDMRNLTKYPCIYTASGVTQETFEIGTTLKPGKYDLDVTVYVMDSKGRNLRGNGGWGRRIWDKKLRLWWFCETAPSEAWLEAANTIPASTEAVTKNITLTVDNYHNAHVDLYEFKKNEMVVFADVQYKGVSVFNSLGGLPNPVPVVEKLDMSVLDRALTYYESAGKDYNGPGVDNSKFNITVPVNLPDGQHIVDVSYYLCMKDGGAVYGNGRWGRRVVDHNRVEKGPYFWLNEYEIGTSFPAAGVPLPTDRCNMRITVDVKNGAFTLTCLDFSKEEMFIINSVKAVDIPNENGVFVAKGLWEEAFDVTTTLTGIPRYVNVTLEVTCRIHDLEGNSLRGNGLWGRRILPDSKTPIWLTADKVENYEKSANALPSADKLVTFNILVTEVTRNGVVTLSMNDFNVGEVVEIINMRYNGELVMGEEIPE